MLKKTLLLSLFFALSALCTIAQKLQIIECVADAQCDALPAEGACSLVQFNQVEVGLSRQKTITIKNNDINNGLEVTISITGTNAPQWKLVDVEDGTNDGILHFSPGTGNALSANQSKVINIVFKPRLTASLGNLPAVLRITSPNTDPCYPDVDISTSALDVELDLIGVATKTPISFAMVLDRSGSMSQIVTGTTRRVDILKTASKYFVDLLAARNNTNDKLSIVRFDHIATPVLLPLAAVNASATRTLIDTSPELNPAGSTGIGKGLQEANTALGAPPAGGKNVTILFTDGEENVGNPFMAAANTSNSAQVFTIGMGSLVTSSFQVALSNYATAKNGGYYFVPNGTTYSSSALPIDLQKAFLGVFTDASGMQGIVDPIYDVQLSGVEKTVSSAWITNSDHKVLFTVFEQAQTRGLYTVEVRSPKGTPVANGAFLPSIEGTITRGEGYSIYAVDFSNAVSDSLYAGKWDLVLIPGKKSTDTNQKSVSIGFAASSFTDLTLNLGLGSTNYTPGNTLKLALDFAESGITLVGVRDIIIKLTTPSGKEVALKAVQDTFGKWVTEYPHTYEAGTYQVFVRATIANTKGQITTREQTKYIAFGHPPATPVDEPCISCTWIKILIVILFVVLLFIIIRTFKK